MRIDECYAQRFERRSDVTPEADIPPFRVDFEDAHVPVSVEDATDDAERAAHALAAGAAHLPPPPLAPAVPDPRDPAPTPLELAIIAMLDQPTTALADATSGHGDDEPAADTEPATELAADLGELPGAAPPSGEVAKQAPPATAPKPAVATVLVHEPAPLPEPPNPSHVHLVLEDGSERVVVTVAVRGSEVNVGLRATDDQIAAALARNAATLDHALRARGLDLASFSAERDPDREEHEHARDHAEPRERDTHDEPFRLEEIA